MCASRDRETSNQIVLTGTAQLLRIFLLSSNCGKTKYRDMGTHENTYTQKLKSQCACTVCLFNSHNPV